MQDVTIIITVYNKAKYLPYSLPRLCDEVQRFKKNAHIICIDDCSQDDSVAVIRRHQERYPNMITLICSEKNQGPSIRLNEAAKAAEGEYLFLIDADDLLRPDVLQHSYELMQMHQADLLYGGFAHADMPIIHLTPSPLAKEELETYAISQDPLDTTITGGYMRMRLMVLKSLFLQAGGADERIFIQDESLPIRLGRYAKCLITLKAPVIIVPAPTSEHLSTNKNQQHHDRFYAYYYLLHDLEAAGEGKRYYHKIYRQIISSYWKSCRRHCKGKEKYKALWYYLLSRITMPSWLRNTSLETLQPHTTYMNKLSHVRVMT